MAEAAEVRVEEQPFTVEGGTLVVPIVDTRLLLPQHTARLDAAMRELAKTRDVALLALTTDELRMVDVAVPPAWLKKTRDPRLRLRALAAVTRRPAVRAAAVAFGQANKLLRINFEIEVCRSEPEARAWLQARGFFAP